MLRAICLILLLGVCTLAQAQPRETPRPAITGIAHLVVYETDMSAVRSFYEGLLGWPAVPPLESPAGMRFLVSGKQYIEVEPLPANVTGDYLGHIAFATSNVKQLLRYMRAKGVEVPKEVSRHRDGSSFFMVHDPEGNSVEFVQTKPAAVPREQVQPVSTHIIHAGFAVHDGAAEDRFYKDVLGFRLYWHSLPHPDGSIDFVSMQVPDGTDWIEYMQNTPKDSTRKRLSSADHFAPGVVSVADTLTVLGQRGWKPSGKNPTRLGHDAKWQLNLRDPSGTRVEIMQFKPTGTPSVPFTGPQPGPES